MLRSTPTRVADTTFLFDPPAETTLGAARPRDMVFESFAPMGTLAPFVTGFWLYRSGAARPKRSTRGTTESPARRPQCS